MSGPKEAFFKIESQYVDFANSRSEDFVKLLTKVKATSGCMSVRLGEGERSNRLVIAAVEQRECEVAMACLKIGLPIAAKNYSTGRQVQQMNINEAESYTKVADIDQELMGMAIGKDRSNIKAVQDKYGVAITVIGDTSLRISGRDFTAVTGAYNELLLVTKTCQFSGEDLNYIVKSGIIGRIKDNDDASSQVRNIRIECDDFELVGSGGKKYKRYQGDGVVKFTGAEVGVDIAIGKLKFALTVSKEGFENEKQLRAGREDFTRGRPTSNNASGGARREGGGGGGAKGGSGAKGGARPASAPNAKPANSAATSAPTPTSTPAPTNNQQSEGGSSRRARKKGNGEKVEAVPAPAPTVTKTVDAKQQGGAVKPVATTAESKPVSKQSAAPASALAQNPKVTLKDAKVGGAAKKEDAKPATAPPAAAAAPKVQATTAPAPKPANKGVDVKHGNITIKK